LRIAGCFKSVKFVIVATHIDGAVGSLGRGGLDRITEWVLVNQKSVAVDHIEGVVVRTEPDGAVIVNRGAAFDIGACWIAPFQSPLGCIIGDGVQVVVVIADVDGAVGADGRPGFRLV